MTNKTISRIGTLLLLVVSAIAFPTLASAGSFLYTYTVTDSFDNVSFSFDTMTLASSGSVFSGFFNVTPGNTVLGFAWNSVAGGSCDLGAGGVYTGSVACAADYGDFGGTGGIAADFTPGSFLKTGTYDSGSGLAVTIQSIPEPSAVAVLGSGLFFVAGGLWRKRNLVAQTAR